MKNTIVGSRGPWQRRLIGPFVGVLMLALLAAGVPLLSLHGTPSTLAASQTVTFTPAADAYVDATYPSTNNGTKTQIRVDGSPVVRSYLRFNVQGLAGSPTKATLRVYANSSGSAGYSVWGVADTTWGETTITSGNAPALAATATGSSGAVTGATWTSVDVTSLITGNGTWSLALTTAGSTAISLASRESGANAPQLVIEAGALAATPTSVPPTPTATPTAVPATATAVPATPTSAPPSATSVPATATSVPSGSGSTFGPVADAYVESANPNTNYGTGSSLRTDGLPVVGSYLQFNVQGLASSPTKATLRVYANSRSKAGYSVRAVADNNWSETTITDANAPAMATTATGSSGAVTGGTWTSVDVTSLVTGNGTWSLGLTTAGSTAISLASRESGANAPQLVIETGALAGTPTSVPPTPTAAPATATSVPATATSVPATATSVPATATSVPPTPTPTQGTVGSNVELSFPIRAAFYYPWFPQAWTQLGIFPYTNYQPSMGYYDSSDPAVILQHIAAMQYGKIQAGIASWWGQGTHTDGRISTILQTSAGTGFGWALYHEMEGSSDPTPAQIQSDLTYMRDRYFGDPSYLKIGGRPVVFVYADGLDACGMADRWTQGNTVNAYVVLKVFPGYKTCANQPQSWHQYSPAVAADSQAGYSYAISPGFWLKGQPVRLARDLARWQQNVRDMVASKAPWQLVTTFSEWGEGTIVESAQEWASASGYGDYLDALHNDGVVGAATPTPAPSVVATPTSGPATATPAATNPPATATAIPATPTKTATIAPTPTPGSGADPILIGAGDIAYCSTTGDEATASLLDAAFAGGATGIVFTAGDNAYTNGTYAEFVNCYDPSWGRHKARTKPATGNHDYLTAGAAGYFDYFNGVGNSTGVAGDRAKGYYSYDLGAWHIVVLNSNCSAAGGCGAGSAQEQWLRADLAANPRTCQAAYYHHPRYSSGLHGSNTGVQGLWQALYDNGVDVVLNGHDHLYERFAPLNASGGLDPTRGIREFIVGMGGKTLYSWSTILPNSEARNNDTFGVMKLTLHPTSYDWQFVPVAGKTFTDFGSQACH